MKPAHVLRAAATVLLITTALAVLPGPARGLVTTYTSAFLDGEPGAYIVREGPTTFPTVTLTHSEPGYVSFVFGGTYSGGVEMWSGGGQPFAVGAYEGAVGSWREPGQAALNVSGAAYGCSIAVARFSIDEVAFDGSGSITKFRARFEHHCQELYAGAGTAAPGAFGAVAYNATAPIPVPVLNQAPLWGGSAPGRATQPHSLMITNAGAGALGIGSITFGGPDAAAFSVLSSTCGSSIAVGASCAVSIGFTPSGASGRRSAVATVFDDLTPGGAGSGRRVPVIGYVATLPNGWSLIDQYPMDADPSLMSTPTGLVALQYSKGGGLVTQHLFDHWSPPQTYGGKLTSSPRGVSGLAGDFIFARGGDGGLYVKTYQQGQDLGWLPLGGILYSVPVVIADGADVEVFAIGGDDALWHQRLSAGTWSGWESLGGIVGSDPSAVVSPAGLFVFALGADDAMWYRHLSGGVWTPWQSLGGIATSLPDSVVVPSGIAVLARGADGGLWYRELGAGGWSAWTGLGGLLDSPPAVVADPTGIYAFAVGLDGAAWMKRWPAGMPTWLPTWENLGGNIISFLAAASDPSGVHVMAVGTDFWLWDRVV